MKELYKSFFKLTPIKTIQTFSFIVFILLFSGITIGLVSTPIQIINVATKISRQEAKWDYSWETYWDIYDSEFLYQYFEANEGKDNYLETSLLNLNSDIEGKTLDSYLKDYFDSNNNKYKNYQEFVGSFIRDNVFSFKYLYSHQVLMPSLAETKILVDFKKIIKEKWVEQSELNYGQVYRLINNDLIRSLKLNGIKIDSNFVYSYSWADYGNQRTKFNLEPINLKQSDNLVLLKGNKKALYTMKDNEIIINDKYAELHQLKIGDYLTLNNYVYEDRQPVSFGTYKIIGFGTKINNLFATNTLTNTDYNSEVYIYLTDAEMLKYVKYLYAVDNSVILANGEREIQNQIFLKTRIIASNLAVEKFSNALSKEKILNENLLLNSYKEENFSKILNMYIVQASIFIIIGMLLLICSVFFINYCLKKELVLIASTIKILKASGYYASEIASIFWIKVFFMLIFGFLIGLFLSLPIQGLIYQIIMVKSFVLINKILLNWIFIFVAIFLTPLLLSLINFIYLTSYLKTPPLEIETKKQVKPPVLLMNTKNWKIRKPFEMALIVRSTRRTNIVITALSLSFLAFCFEINTKQFMINLTDQWTSVYQNIDSAFSVDYKFNWKKEENNKLNFNEANEYNISFDRYDNEDFPNQQIDSKIEEEIQTYLKMENQQASLQLIKILAMNINQKTLQISSLEKFLTKIVSDVKKGNNFPINEKIAKEIEENWISQFPKLNEKIIKKNITISFNKIFIKNNIDFPVYKIDLTNKPYKYKSYRDWKLILLSNYSYNAFKWSGTDKNTLFNQKIRNVDYFPVVVTEHFAKLNNLKIGDTFEADLAISNEDSSLKMKINGINKADIYTNNIYGADKSFIDHFTNLNPKINLINEILTKNQSLIFNKNLSEFKINSNYFSFFIPGNQKNITILKLISNSEKIHSFITWNSFSDKKYENYNLQKQITKNQTQNFNNLMNIIGMATLLILSILYLVLILVAILEEKNYLMVLKAMGINNFILNLNINLRIFWGVTISCILGIAANYFIWNIVVNLLFNKARILAPSPFSWSVVLMGIIVIFAIFSLGMTTVHIILRKINIASKNYK